MPGTPGTRESQVEAHEGRKYVVVMPFRHPKTPYGDPPGPTQLQIYDASQDCKNPVRVGTYDFPFVTHEHRISADGNTIYVASTSASTNPNPQQHLMEFKCVPFTEQLLYGEFYKQAPK